MAITVDINRPLEAVYQFTLNPANTPLWIDGVEREETSEWPIQIGTIYRNRMVGEDWKEYTVTQLIPMKLFELTAADGIHKTQYLYEMLSENMTRMTYSEFAEIDGFQPVLDQAVVEKLKQVIENKLSL